MPGITGIMDFEIKVGGAALASEKAMAVLELVVDSSAHLPSMCTITFHDPDLALIDGTDFDIGKELEIKLEGVESYGSASRELSLVLIFKGEVTALEPEYRVNGGSLVVRAYDKSHRLHRGKKTRTFAKQKDSAIASTIAGEAGLTPSVDATT